MRLGIPHLRPWVLVFFPESTLLVCKKTPIPQTRKLLPDGKPITAPPPKSPGTAFPFQTFLFGLLFFVTQVLELAIAYEPKLCIVILLFESLLPVFEVGNVGRS